MLSKRWKKFFVAKNTAKHEVLSFACVPPQSTMYFYKNRESKMNVRVMIDCLLMETPSAMDFSHWTNVKWNARFPFGKYHSFQWFCHLAERRCENGMKKSDRVGVGGGRGRRLIRFAANSHTFSVVDVKGLSCRLLLFRKMENRLYAVIDKMKFHKCDFRRISF